MPQFDSAEGGYAAVERHTISHGHSTPQMAGQFARRVGARKLAMTHFSPRYRGDASIESVTHMKQIERAAAKTSLLDPFKVQPKVQIEGANRRYKSKVQAKVQVEGAS